MHNITHSCARTRRIRLGEEERRALKLSWKEDNTYWQDYPLVRPDIMPRLGGIFPEHADYIRCNAHPSSSSSSSFLLISQRVTSASHSLLLLVCVAGKKNPRQSKPRFTSRLLERGRRRRARQTRKEGKCRKKKEKKMRKRGE